MVAPIASPHLTFTRPRVVEPVCASCDCNDQPNAFASAPVPFSKFLERQNAIERFVEAGIYSPKSNFSLSGRALDVYA